MSCGRDIAPVAGGPKQRQVGRVGGGYSDFPALTREATGTRYNRFLRSISFEVVAECRETGARAGLLHTPHGTIETPVFMPVGTQGTVKGLTQRDLAGDLGVQILLANTYHLFVRPGHELIRSLGGLHKFMSWPNAILTDSG